MAGWRWRQDGGGGSRMAAAVATGWWRQRWMAGMAARRANDGEQQTTVAAEMRMFKTIAKEERSALKSRVRGGGGTSDVDLLAWFQARKSILPVHWSLARKALPIMATEANAERLFSMAGHSITHGERNKLGWKMLELGVRVP